MHAQVSDRDLSHNGTHPGDAGSSRRRIQRFGLCFMGACRKTRKFVSAPVDLPAVQVIGCITWRRLPHG